MKFWILTQTQNCQSVGIFFKFGFCFLFKTLIWLLQYSYVSKLFWPKVFCKVFSKARGIITRDIIHVQKYGTRMPNITALQALYFTPLPSPPFHLHPLHSPPLHSECRCQLRVATKEWINEWNEAFLSLLCLMLIFLFFRYIFSVG